MKETEIKIIVDNNEVPKMMTHQAAGYDVCCNKNFILRPGRNRIPTGIYQQFDSNIVCMVDPRGGFSMKGFEAYNMSDIKFEYPKRVDADVIHGTGDADYTGEYGVFVYSREKRPFVIKKGTRICQFVYIEVVRPTFKVVDKLEETERGDGAYGHTGTL